VAGRKVFAGNFCLAWPYYYLGSHCVFYRRRGALPLNDVTAGDWGAPSLHFLFMAAVIWLVLLVGSQMGHIIDHRKNFGGAFLINQEDNKIVFRSVLFTQSLYFAACL
jgi:hypothetical protein